MLERAVEVQYIDKCRPSIGTGRRLGAFARDKAAGIRSPLFPCAK